MLLHSRYNINLSDDVSIKLTLNDFARRRYLGNYYYDASTKGSDFKCENYANISILTLSLTNSVLYLTPCQYKFAILVHFLYFVYDAKYIKNIVLHPKQNIESDLKCHACSCFGAHKRLIVR